MAAQTKPKPVRKKARRRKPPEEIVDYIVEIEDWDFGYWLALNTLREPLDPYHEHQRVQLKGRMLRPTGLTTDRVEISIFLSMSLMEERRNDLKPIAVGSLQAYPERIDANMSRCSV